MGKSGEQYIETFNADNLYEKIDGRAESFIQYGVKGMAYTFYHPTGDPSNELQLYVFEMADSLKALGKYGSEKPDESKVSRRSATRATRPPAARSSTRASITPRSSRPRTTPSSPPSRSSWPSASPPGRSREAARRLPTVAASQPASASAPAPTAESTAQGRGRSARRRQARRPRRSRPATYFGFLPAAGKQGDPKYVAQDVFGYSFLSDVFMADYKEGDVTWQGFLRPYRDAKEAKAVLEKYIAGVKKDGAEVKTLAAEGADEMVVSSNIGLVDVVFRKGNTLAGANGATSAAPAEAFARALAKSLPATVPTLDSGK